MNKILLLLASFALAVSCSKPATEPTPEPEPKPEPDPTVEYSINRTEVTLTTLDTIHLFILNAQPDQYEWEATNVNIVRPVNKEMTEFQALAFGETSFKTTIGGKTFTCNITVNKKIEVMPYDMPIVSWGDMIDNVKAEALKTGTLIEEGEADEGLFSCSYEITNPKAPNGQIIEYLFENNVLIQSFMLAKYETTAQASEAWVYTLERCVYLGQDTDKYDQGTNAATDPTIQYIFTRGTEKETKYPVFVCYFVEPTPNPASINASDRKVKTYLSKKYNLVDTYHIPSLTIAHQ